MGAKSMLRYELLLLALILECTGSLFSGPTTKAADRKPGVERWEIKTSLTNNDKPPKAKVISLDKLLALQEVPGVKKNDARFNSARIASFTNPLGVKEGDIITTTGWIHLIAFEDDGDYHIQMSNDPVDGNNCLIVELPNNDPEYTSSPALQTRFQWIRDTLKNRLTKGVDPTSGGNVMKGQVYVTITGQLFYDDSHVGDPPRGKRGMKAATLWELHPIIDFHFAPKQHK